MTGSRRGWSRSTWTTPRARSTATRRAPPGTAISKSKCLHPLFVFNQFGDLERCALRPGNVHSADGWEDVLRAPSPRSICLTRPQSKLSIAGSRPSCASPTRVLLTLAPTSRLARQMGNAGSINRAWTQSSQVD